MQEEDITEKLSEVVKEDIWGNIKEILNFGFHFGKDENQVHITIGLLLLIAFFFFRYQVSFKMGA